MFQIFKSAIQSQSRYGWKLFLMDKQVNNNNNNNDNNNNISLFIYLFTKSIIRLSILSHWPDGEEKKKKEKTNKKQKQKQKQKQNNNTASWNQHCAIQIIFIIILLFSAFFTPALADGFPLDFESQQAPSSL